MANKINNTQRIILTAAAAREGHRVLPLPPLKAPMVAVRRTIGGLLKAGLVEEIAASSADEVWEEGAGDRGMTLIATAEGLRVVGIAALPAAKPITRVTRPQGPDKPTESAKRRPAPATSRVRSKKGETKQQVLVSLLRRGASIAEMSRATGWQAHSVRGALSAVVKGRLGLPVISEKGPDGVRRYHVAVLATDTRPS
jgi:hypothetical protein